MLRWVCVCLTLMGCDALGLGEPLDSDPPPPPNTARFTADAVLQDCYWGGENWIGVQALHLTLEHRTDGVVPREIPAPGTCTSSSELYAEQALDGGDPVPGLDSKPKWTAVEESGRLPAVIPGLWHGNAFSSPTRCGTLEESVGGGVELVEAGALSGLSTPAVESYGDATADGGRFADHEGVLFGDTVELAWQADGWDAGFVQVWREHEGEIREIITCGVQGNEFVVDDSLWSQANESLLAEGNRVIVGLVREDEVELDDGSAVVRLATRALHVLEPR